MSSDTKHRPNYYLLIPGGIAQPIYIKDLEAAKAIIMQMEQKVQLIKIKRK